MCVWGWKCSECVTQSAVSGGDVDGTSANRINSPRKPFLVVLEWLMSCEDTAESLFVLIFISFFELFHTPPTNSLKCTCGDATKVLLVSKPCNKHHSAWRREDSVWEQKGGAGASGHWGGLGKPQPGGHLLSAEIFNPAFWIWKKKNLFSLKNILYPASKDLDFFYAALLFFFFNWHWRSCLQRIETGSSSEVAHQTFHLLLLQLLWRIQDFSVAPQVKQLAHPWFILLLLLKTGSLALAGVSPRWFTGRTNRPLIFSVFYYLMDAKKPTSCIHAAPPLAPSFCVS